MGNHEDHGGRFLSGLAIGVLLGVGLYYFLTSTEEGKKIKKELKEKGEDAIDNLADIIGELEEKSEEFKQKAEEVQLQLEEKAHDVKEEVIEEAQTGLSQIEKLRERGRRAVKFFTRNGKSLA